MIKITRSFYRNIVDIVKDNPLQGCSFFVALPHAPNFHVLEPKHVVVPQSSNLSTAQVGSAHVKNKNVLLYYFIERMHSHSCNKDTLINQYALDCIMFCKSICIFIL